MSYVVNNICKSKLEWYLVMTWIKTRQGKLTDYIIKNLKSEIDSLVLEDYSNFRFNDVKHEIYTKIKDSAITDDDYIYLNGYLIGLINNDIAYKEITQ